MKQISLFAEENRLQKLSDLGDCLERLKVIDRESFRPTIALALIRDYEVTPANVHDSNEFEEFFGEEDQAAYADSAYVGKELPEHIRNEICEKGYRNKPLTEKMD